MMHNVECPFVFVFEIFVFVFVFEILYSEIFVFVFVFVFEILYNGIYVYLCYEILSESRLKENTRQKYVMKILTCSLHTGKCQSVC